MGQQREGKKTSKNTGFSVSHIINTIWTNTKLCIQLRKHSSTSIAITLSVIELQ